jgi:hypothetical protein
MLDEKVTFYEWEFVSEGTHAQIYRAKESMYGMVCCIKVFQAGWMTPFNLEKAAYEAFLAAGIRDCIPKVYAWGYRTMSEWDIPNRQGETEERYGIVMEWLKRAEQVNPENLTFDHASALLSGLGEIHAAGVVHYDLDHRNMIVIPGSKWAVWIDFSSSHLNEEYGLPQAMNIAQGIVMQTVYWCRVSADSRQRWQVRRLLH